LGGGTNPQFSKKLGNGINLDVRPNENVDILANFEEPLPLPSDEFDIVFSRFVLEHVSWRKVSQFIAEIYRILKPNGRALLITANLLEQAKVLVSKNAWDLNDLCMVFGDLDYPENSHKSSMSPDLATRLFKEAGFRNVTISPLPNCLTDMVIESWK
jgi:ubiquinone/menaquinone biosynthesis C-methylase UbiE